MINGVKTKKLIAHKDKRGFFMEIIRSDDNLLDKFGQSSISLAKPGVIKAFHWHKEQDDVFYVLNGKAIVVLYDQRKRSKTYGKLQSFTMSENEPKLLYIPKGVAHGYKALGKKPLLMLYFMSRCYDPKSPDEQRISHDDKKIGFDWSRHN